MPPDGEEDERGEVCSGVKDVHDPEEEETGGDK